MDEATFEKELAKYKVVRKMDYYKQRYIKPSKKQQEKRELPVASKPAITTTVAKTKSTTSETVAFWDVVAASPRSGLSGPDWNRFVTAMKQVHKLSLLFKYVAPPSLLLFNPIHFLCLLTLMYSAKVKLGRF